MFALKLFGGIALFCGVVWGVFRLWDEIKWRYGYNIFNLLNLSLLTILAICAGIIFWGYLQSGENGFDKMNFIVTGIVAFLVIGIVAWRNIYFTNVGFGILITLVQILLTVVIVIILLLIVYMVLNKIGKEEEKG